MDEPTLTQYLIAAVKWLGAALGGIALYVVRQWRSDHQDLAARVAHVESSYITRADFVHGLERLESKLEVGFTRLHEKLDRKADR